MTHDKHLVTEGWEDYELLDSGEGMKLERFGTVVLARPETQALWAKRGEASLWERADAVFTNVEGGKGAWRFNKNAPKEWELSHRAGPAGEIRCIAKTGGFKHIGIFPEQAPNWHWIAKRAAALPEKSRVLNLFGYTGIASVAAAKAGAAVTHVDSSKQSVDWARQNAQLARLPEDAIRWIVEDASAFAKRERRRGSVYEGIILDPPAFGRGAKGEVWHIEDDLLRLLENLKPLLSPHKDAFFLMNGYAAGYASRAFAQAVESVFGDVNGESGEMFIRESHTNRVVPSGMYTRFVRE